MCKTVFIFRNNSKVQNIPQDTYGKTSSNDSETGQRLGFAKWVPTYKLLSLASNRDVQFSDRKCFFVIFSNNYAIFAQFSLNKQELHE